MEDRNRKTGKGGRGAKETSVQNWTRGKRRAEKEKRKR